MSEQTKWENLARLLRKLILTSTTAAGSGHMTSALSAVELATVLFDKYFRFDIKNPPNPNNDRFILSKGHASPLFYALWAVAGAIDAKEVLRLRKIDSVLEGHPSPRFKYTDVATGSLGQGLSIGAGMALSIQNSEFKIQNLPKVFVVLGDGEMAEGNVWEAANFTSYYKLNNLIAMVDVNRLGQSQETMLGHKTAEYSKRLNGFGWQTVEIDGHDLGKIDEALEQAQKASAPFAIIAKTIKGKGVSFLEDKNGWHGKVLKKEELKKALGELGEMDEKVRFNLAKHLGRWQAESHDSSEVESTAAETVHLRGAHPATSEVSYQLGDEIATREAYGSALVKLGDSNSLVYALDGDVKNSTYSEKFKEAHPDRFIECFIAEQNMVGVALGLSKREKIPFVSTFACFFTRAFDQIRMAALSRANIKFVGSHAGVSIGEDGPSQMGLEDLAMFGAVPGSIIFHPADAVSTEKIVVLMAQHKGISYLRTLRPKMPVLYDNDEEFSIGGSKVLKKSEKDVLTVIACGITVHEALKAYEQLRQNGILVRILDCYCLKPIDAKTIQQCSNSTIHPIIITVEDHYGHGGLGDFVLDAVSGSGAKVVKLAVRQIPRSGKPEELLEWAGIDSTHIVNLVKKLT